MATQTAIAVPATQVRSLDTGLFTINGKPVLPVTANGDRQVLFTAPHAMRVSAAHLRVPATLGASVVCKLQKNSATVYTDLTAATTAATAGVVTSAGLLPLDMAAGDTVELLVAGAASTAGGIEYDVNVQRA